MRSYEVTKDGDKNGHVDNKQNVEAISMPEVTPGLVIIDASQGISNPGLSVSSGSLDNGIDTPTRGSVEQFEEAGLSLIAARHEHIRKKDFGSEIRARKDISNYLDEVSLLLDLSETKVEEIVDTMLMQMLQEEPTVSKEEAKEIFFMEDVQQLTKMIQSTCETGDGGGVDYDQSWLCSFGAVPNVQRRRIVIARLTHPTNFGHTCQEIQFLILIATPTKEKGTKTEFEASRTFATLFSSIELRRQLLQANDEKEFKSQMTAYMTSLRKVHDENLQDRICEHTSIFEETFESDVKCKFPLGTGIINDLKRRVPLYWSDYTDGVLGKGTLHKTISCVFYLYFACLLPAIAIGVLNEKNTNYMDVTKGIYAQAIGGLVYGLFAGQPLVILRTTVPIAIYLQVISEISSEEVLGVPFKAFYACVGLWCSLFTLIYAVTGLSKIMKWSTRSTEEIFAMFISIAFIVDSTKDTVHDFEDCYIHENKHNVTVTTTATTPTNHSGCPKQYDKCGADSSLLYLLLALGTLWFGLFLYNFTKTPYLNHGKRELLADYSLPAAVIVGSFFGSFVFQKVYLHEFCRNEENPVFEFPPLNELKWPAILAGLGLGFSLSLLFFMDHNISAAMVQSPTNRLKKGPSLHWDLVVVSLINIGLSLCGIPWVHGALPHSPLHVHALADTEERVDQGHVHQRVVRVRETRVSTLLAHVLIALSVLMMPIPLQFIPRAVLNGLFLIMSITALDHIQFFERIMLLFTEQAAYPPNHYIRCVPQRKIHLFTGIQFIQLIVLCLFGFFPLPYMKMCFPVLLMIMLPIRHKLVPKVIPEKYLASIDGHI